MKLELINKRNYPINEKLSQVIMTKMEKLDKYFDEQPLVKIYLKSEGDMCKMELNLNLGKQFLSAQAVCENMYDAIDKCIPKIEKQIVKYRAKFDKKLKKTAFKEDVYSGEEEKIVKVKEFEMQPMAVEEAIFQMDTSGHEFFVFLNEQSKKIEVLYKRFDNDYGVIKPIVNE